MKTKLTAAAFAAALIFILAGCTLKSPAAGSAPAPETPCPTAATTPVPTPEPTPGPVDPFREMLNGMTAEQKLCQLFFVSPESMTGAKAFYTAADDELTGELADYPVGGIILYGGNLSDPAQTTAFISAIRARITASCGIVPFMGIDEEGGLVARVASKSAFGVRNVGDMRDIGRSGDTGAAYSAADYIAGYLSPLGFNVNFAPVADVLTNPDNTVVRSRSFGSDPRLVSGMVLSQISVFSSHGIIACPKHFPGHGATGGDTHSSMTYTNKNWDELLQCELIPFIDAVNSGAPMIMVGHFALPNVTGDYTPCSLSYTVITQKLKNELGFNGLVITDDLSMAAVTLGYTPGEAAVRAFEAGADLLLMTDDFSSAYEAMLSAVNSGRISPERLDESVYRILSAKAGLR